MVLGLQNFAERSGNGPLLDANAGEELMCFQPDVTIALGRRPLESPGTLYITSKRVIWLSDLDKGKGYAVDFLSISLHAVSRDPEAYSLPCIYTQIETENGEDDGSEDSDSETLVDGELSKITEMRLVPSDSSRLDNLFEVFCRCAELNPEPHEEGDEENSWVFGDEEMGDDGDFECQLLENSSHPIGYANGKIDIVSTVSELQINDQRFDDAEGEHEMHEDHHGEQ